VFGVGWAINLYRAKTLLESTFERLMGAPPPLSIRMTSRSQPSRSRSGPRETGE
jgi:hypothetical protein